ncbi:MAG: hypothetical protein ABIG68_11345 [Acidobacteriota bacterium]
MSASSWRVSVVILAITLTGAGCGGPTERLNAPPQGFTGPPNRLQEFYTPMVDNAMLYDMCIADIHFYPHSAKINGLGEWRLKQFCRLLSEDGGIIHLETAHPDDELTQARIQKVSDFFVSSGFTAAAVTVEVGLPRGRPLDGAQAVRILQEGTVNDLGSSSD